MISPSLWEWIKEFALPPLAQCNIKVQDIIMKNSDLMSFVLGIYILDAMAYKKEVEYKYVHRLLSMDFSDEEPVTYDSVLRNIISNLEKVDIISDLTFWDLIKSQIRLYINDILVSGALRTFGPLRRWMTQIFRIKNVTLKKSLRLKKSVYLFIFLKYILSEWPGDILDMMDFYPRMLFSILHELSTDFVIEYKPILHGNHVARLVVKWITNNKNKTEAKVKTGIAKYAEKKVDMKMGIAKYAEKEVDMEAKMGPSMKMKANMGDMSEAKVDVYAEMKTKAKVKAKVEVEIETDKDAEAMARTEAELEAEAFADAEAIARTEAIENVEAEAFVDAEAEAMMKTEVKAKMEKEENDGRVCVPQEKSDVM